MTRNFDVAKTSLCLDASGVGRNAPRRQLCDPCLEVERDLGIDVLRGERRAANWKPKESAGAGGKH